MLRASVNGFSSCFIFKYKRARAPDDRSFSSSKVSSFRTVIKQSIVWYFSRANDPHFRNEIRVIGRVKPQIPLPEIRPPRYLHECLCINARARTSMRLRYVYSCSVEPRDCTYIINHAVFVSRTERVHVQGAQLLLQRPHATVQNVQSRLVGGEKHLPGILHGPRVD